MSIEFDGHNGIKVDYSDVDRGFILSETSGPPSYLLGDDLPEECELTEAMR